MRKEKLYGHTVIFKPNEKTEQKACNDLCDILSGGKPFYIIEHATSERYLISPDDITNLIDTDA